MPPQRGEKVDAGAFKALVKGAVVRDGLAEETNDTEAIPMRIVAFITTRAVIDRILDHVRRPRDTARGPPRRAPRRPARQPA